MKINSINHQTNKQPNFKANIFDKTAKAVANHPEWVAALAGSTVVAQKVVMSGSEAVIGPVMDIGIGHAITKATGEKDNRTNESSKVQAIRTFSQSVGGTIVGVAIRLACIGAVTASFMKLGGKAGNKIAEVINPEKISKEKDLYNYTDNMEKWGKTIGGVVATGIMLVTNFIIDAPFINWINTKATNFVDGFSKKDNQPQEQQAKEVK